MFIFHSFPDAVRVTVVGRYNKGTQELELAVARCSKRDDFLKRTKVYPGRPAFTVETKNGPKTIPAREEKTVEGGVDIAIKRLENNEIFGIFPMEKFSQRQFNLIASGIADMAKNNPKLVTESTIGK